MKFPHVQKSHLTAVPIRHIDFKSPTVERQHYTEKVQSLYDQFCTNNDEALGYALFWVSISTPVIGRVSSMTCSTA